MDDRTREALEAILGRCIATGKDQWETAQVLERYFQIEMRYLNGSGTEN